MATKVLYLTSCEKSQIECFGQDLKSFETWESFQISATLVLHVPMTFIRCGRLINDRPFAGILGWFCSHH